MANWSDPRMSTAAPAASVGARGVAYDAGLRAYMLSVYNYMASGILLTGVVAMLVARSGLAMQLMQSPLRLVVMLAPLAFVMVLSFGINRLSTTAAQMIFWAFAAVMGMSLSSIFLVYTQTSIAQAFFATAGAFAGLSLFGYTTQRNLSAMGSFMIMGLFGIIIASLLNMFVFKSGGMELAISALSVLIFAGLTAYDTQRIKSMYSYVAGTDMVGKTVIMSALNLYLDFINMFMSLLRLFGSRN